MKIKIAANPTDAVAIRELLSPWNATYTREDDADVSIFYGQKPTSSGHSVIIPSNSEAFKMWAKRNNLGITAKSGSLIHVFATTNASLLIKPEIMYSFESKTGLFFDENNSPFMEPQEDTVVLKINAVDEFFSIINRTLNPVESKIHRIATGLPLAYSIIPKRLRNFFLKSSCTSEDLTLSDKLPIDALRFLLVNAIEKVSNKVLEKKAIYSGNYVCILTHDIETASGLQRANVIKKIEQKYDIPSAWYLPSKRYKLDNEIIRGLAYHGEIGVHDTTHDGKLSHLQKSTLVKRFSEAKNSIEKVVEHNVDGFRAPVLQHSPRILKALGESGFRYDTSIPTWEPKHPFTMKSHGIGTIFPLSLNGLIEIPLTLTQDHQLLYTLGLEPEEVMRTWATMATLIRELGGVCMFLVHPDYKFGDNYANLYEDLVNIIVNDCEATVTLPSRLCGLINEYQPTESCLKNSIQL